MYRYLLTVAVFALAVSTSHAAIIGGLDLPASENPADWLKVTFKEDSLIYNMDVWPLDPPDTITAAGHKTVWLTRDTSNVLFQFGDTLTLHDLSPYMSDPELKVEVGVRMGNIYFPPIIRYYGFQGGPLTAFESVHAPEPSTFALALLVLVGTAALRRTF